MAMKIKQIAEEVPKETPKECPVVELTVDSKPMSPELVGVEMAINSNRGDAKHVILEMCLRCHMPIGYDCKAGETRITEKSDSTHHWHSRCFNCTSCKVSLLSKPFYRPGPRGNLLCAKCMDDVFSDICARCGHEINRYSQQQRQVSSMDGKRHFHVEGCFACYKCSKSLRAGAGVYCHENGDGIFCRECYDEITCKVCIQCKQRILRYSKDEKLITASDGLAHWHEQCFKCSRCTENLLNMGGNFFWNQDGGMYCELCLKHADNNSGDNLSFDDLS